MTIRALMKRRAEFNQMLAGCNNLNSGRYLRLMGLAGIELVLGIPWSVYSSLYNNIHAPHGSSESPIQPWISWDSVHLNFGYVGQFPAFEWKADPNVVVSLELPRWSVIICAFIFFGFFGFAQEARKNYRLAFNSVAKKVGYTTLGFNSGVSSTFGGSKQPTTSTTGRGTGTLPVYIRQETTSKRDSCASFSTNLTLGDVGGTLDDVKEPYSPTDSASGSSRQSIDEKSISPPYPPALQQPEPTVDAHSPQRHSTDAKARPDSNII
jgi:pheromone a factor receptor